MTGPIAWFARNPVAANLLMLFILLAGLTTLSAIPQKSFPDVDIDVITVTVEYLGAAPEEVESGVCSRIEEEVDGVEDIEQLRSTSVEGQCAVTIELIQGSDVARALDEVKNRVDAIDTFPEETEKPIISQVTNVRPVIDVAVSGETDERTLKELAQRVRDEIARLDGVTQVELAIARPYEISIEVSESALLRYGLRFDDVALAVRRSSLDLPGGSIKTAGGEILLRVQGQAYWGPEFEKLVVRTHADGTRLYLSDVAQVRDGFEDTDQLGRFDGRPVLLVRVFRVGEQDLLHISNAVRAYVENASVPEGIDLTVWKDGSRDLRDRRDIMLRNGRMGFVLVFLVLALFLKPRVAFWVSLGIPVAFTGALAMLSIFDLSIDVISLFAFILVLGILVDDAIVVGENVFTHQSRGEDRLGASIRGTQEVAVPVIFGVLTTVAAFAPLLGVDGVMGTVFRVMSIVVISCLLFSLVEAQLVLPAHLGHGQNRARPPGRSPLGRRVRELQGRWDSFQEGFSTGLETFTSTRFRHWVERAVEWRYLTVAIAVGLLFVTFGVLRSGHMKFSFFPPLEADYVSARLTMPQGTPAMVTETALRQIEDAIEALRADLDPEWAPEGESLVIHSLTALGEHPFARTQNGPPAGGGRGTGGAHLGEVTLELVPSEEREISTGDVANRWRELTGPVAGAEELIFASSLFSAGQEIFVQLQGPDVDALAEAAERLRVELATYEGVIDIADSFREGKQEVKLAILPGAEALGLTLSDLARQVRQGFYGEEIQRIQRGRHDVRVMVRYPENERRSLGDLENMRVRTPDGGAVPFHSVARADVGRGFSTIRRADRERVVNVTADVDRDVTTGNAVLGRLEEGPLQWILADYPGMTYSFEGIQNEQRKAFQGLRRWYPVALFAIFALLAIPLRSYAQPLIIMSVIPFGVVGAVAGHLIMGKGLSFMSLQGMIALTGVVVNSSLLMVHNVNLQRSQGLALGTSAVNAAVARFRPIVLTSLTTFAGLTPLLLERSVQAQFLVPMATSLAFGVLFAAVITLLLVPASYLILEDLQQLGARWRALRPPLQTEVAARAIEPEAPQRGARAEGISA